QASRCASTPEFRSFLYVRFIRLRRSRIRSVIFFLQDCSLLRTSCMVYYIVKIYYTHRRSRMVDHYREQSMKENTVPYLLKKRAESYPDDIAYSYPELQQSCTWSALWHDVRLAAKGLLQSGVRKGDAVAVL